MGVMVTSDESSVCQQGGDYDGNGYSTNDKSQTSDEWVGGPGTTVDDRGLVQEFPGFLTGWTWTLVTTVTYDGIPGSCPYESNGDGNDFGYLTKWTTKVGVVLKWCRR